ncbi:MAG: Hsp20/alpha crystallin family protein [Dehalococcoidia bacterium]|nr:Hsp20/alpha crystallin family protein [Dehalococcoidia bacterium]
MANIIRWDPFGEMTSLRRAMDRWLEEGMRPWRLPFFDGEGYAPIDMYETDNEIVVKASLPGVKPEDVDITIAGETLTIKGETKHEEEEKKANYYRKENWYGTFARSISLPSQVEAEKAHAEFENGMLRLTIPKAEQVRPKSIKVTAKGMIEGEKKS